MAVGYHSLLAAKNCVKKSYFLTNWTLTLAGNKLMKAWFTLSVAMTDLIWKRKYWIRSENNDGRDDFTE
jgi:hypothetical protein